MIDVLFVTPNSSKKSYQDLSITYSAIEPPTWSLLLAEACRSKNYNVAILDAEAERLNDEETIKKIKDHKPRLVLFVLYCQNQNSGTTSMIGACDLGEKLKLDYTNCKIALVGSHISALPKQVLA